MLIDSERFGDQLFGFGDAQLAGKEFGEEGVANCRELLDLLIILLLLSKNWIEYG